MSIYILCPSGSTTGGAECLHQFGQALIANGAEVYMSYVPDETGNGTGEFFNHYGVPSAKPVDDVGNIVVVPELYTYLAKQFPKSKKAIFWLSVDNYLGRKRKSVLADWYRRIRSLSTTRIPVWGMKNFVHISQSNYATKFLSKQGKESLFVGDYLNDNFFKEVADVESLGHEKLDQVAYNPKKGKKYIDYVALKNPHLKFIPIINMTRSEVITMLSKSKMYVDLGQHPGKDRIPREAAVMGCCILTSKIGSAANDVDVPIPTEYKYDLNRKELRRIPSQIKKVFMDYENESAKFDPYRVKICNEKHQFFEDSKKWLEHIKEGI